MQLVERAREGQVVLLVADTLLAVAELLKDQGKQVKLQAYNTARKLRSYRAMGRASSDNPT